jgi:hypothetical protein
MADVRPVPSWLQPNEFFLGSATAMTQATVIVRNRVGEAQEPDMKGWGKMVVTVTGDRCLRFVPCNETRADNRVNHLQMGRTKAEAFGFGARRVILRQWCRGAACLVATANKITK